LNNQMLFHTQIQCGIINTPDIHIPASQRALIAPTRFAQLVI
jgi:hypothetical protein